MNKERQKTDAIADAVEIPDGATHYIDFYGYISYHKKIGSFWYEITKTKNIKIHSSWIHLLQPL